MLEVKIYKKISDYDYILIDSNKNTYNINIELIDFPLENDDLIQVSEYILKNENIYTFKKSDKAIYEDINEILIVKRNNENFIFERVYG